jgi:hypothetical protein
MNYNIFTVNDAKRIRKYHGISDSMSMNNQYVNEQILVENCKLYKRLFMLRYDTIH